MFQKIVIMFLNMKSADMGNDMENSLRKEGG